MGLVGYNSAGLNPTYRATGAGVPSLVSLLADPDSGAAALSLLHQEAVSVAGAACSLLVELDPARPELRATSGTGLDSMPLDGWDAAGEEARTIANAFARRLPHPVADLAAGMPRLQARLRTPHAVLVPLLADTRRVGLLALGTVTGPDAAADALAGSDDAQGRAAEGARPPGGLPAPAQHRSRATL
jgi:hypothetical protein